MVGCLNCMAAMMGVQPFTQAVKEAVGKRVVKVSRSPSLQASQNCLLISDWSKELLAILAGVVVCEKVGGKLRHMDHVMSDQGLDKAIKQVKVSFN